MTLKEIETFQRFVDVLSEQKAIDDRECETMVGAAAKEVKQVMIDKACEWLKANVHNDLSIGTYEDTIETIVGEFTKAMEK